jgi:hypothetical protein
MTAYQVELALTLLAALTAVIGLATGRAARLWTVATTALVAVALALAWLGTDGGQVGDGSRHPVLTLAAGVVAVAGGGLVTTQVFGIVDRASPVRRSGEVLRGGAWIGALERLAVYVALVAGWGPGLAIVLAVKGLGRYPELRSQEDSGAAERFIIGTFTSVLWAVACVGLAVLAP